jgi:hypothetical protein
VGIRPSHPRFVGTRVWRWCGCPPRKAAREAGQWRSAARAAFSVGGRARQARRSSQSCLKPARPREPAGAPRVPVSSDCLRSYPNCADPIHFGTNRDVHRRHCKRRPRWAAGPGRQTVQVCRRHAHHPGGGERTPFSAPPSGRVPSRPTERGQRSAVSGRSRSGTLTAPANGAAPGGSRHNARKFSRQRPFRRRGTRRAADSARMRGETPR